MPAAPTGSRCPLRTDLHVPRNQPANLGEALILTAAAQAHGPGALGPLYSTLGTRYHLQEQPKTRPTIEAALRDAGLPTDLADAG
jgi:hypothetical protein